MSEPLDLEPISKRVANRRAELRGHPAPYLIRDAEALIAEVERLRDLLAQVATEAHGHVRGSQTTAGFSPIIDLTRRA